MSSSRVLVVEDDEHIASLVQRTLVDAGIDSDLATTGPDGLWKAREGAYGAMVLDVLLPGLNGYEICRTLRTEGASVGILMLTAKSGEHDETDGFEMGADDYLRKPFSPAVLVLRVRALLRRVPGTSFTERLTSGDLALDLRTRTCTVGGAAVDLTARETALLEVLLRHADAPLSRSRLLDEVWGIDFEGDPNIVDVYVGYLRRKLGRERIQNRRNIGFRIIP